MNIALIGYGRMGKEIEKFAIARKHNIALIIDKDNRDDLKRLKQANIDVAIEFTVPDQAPGNIKMCLESGVSVVSGTTGWMESFDEIMAATLKSDSALLYSSNFNIGVNIMFHLNRNLSKLMRERTEYKAGIEEIHHTKKIDTPSGTAISLAQTIINNNSRYSKWENYTVSEKRKFSGSDEEIPIFSLREGDVPGTHEIKWESSLDSISLKHEAYSREGFALGAILAAEFVMGKNGFLTMGDMLGF